MDYILLFVLNAAGMILELVASRLLSPYFGNSNFVWTAIIGIILLAGSFGNLIGGKLSSNKNSRLYAFLLLLITAVYLAAIPLVGTDVLSSIDAMNGSVQVSSVISSILLFLFPATTMGIITPIVMKERIGHAKDKGKESGRITAIIAIGSLAGTFLGGFLLIPLLGTRMIFVMLSFVVIISSILLKPWSRNTDKKSRIVIGLSLIVATIVCIVCSLNVGATQSSEDSISIDTEYGRIIIEESSYGGVPVRLYKQSGAYASATFLQKGRRFDLVFDYLKKYDKAFNYLDVRDALMIGGAAYQYPKYYISHFLDKKLDVVEIDPMSTQIAKQYFYLDDLINEYGSDRIGLYNEDGRVYLANNDKKYDAIFNDAFSGEVPVGTLATKEAAELIKNNLVDDGVYLSNVLAAVNGDKGRFLRSEVKTLKEVFDYVYVLPMRDNSNKDDFSNWVVIATDNDSYRPTQAFDVNNEESDILLTDDYCPIDSLVDTYYHE